MHPTALKLQGRLRERGLAISAQMVPASTRTAPEAAAVVGCEVGQIVKSLVFMRGEEPVMVVCAAGTPLAVFEVDTDTLISALPDASVQDVS